MPRLKPVSWREFVRRRRELGFEGPYAGGRHPQTCPEQVEWMRRGNGTVIITNSHESEIYVGFLTSLLRQAGVTCEEWLGEV